MLYQLWCDKEYPRGTPLNINGPWDRFGRVMSTVRKETDGSFLLLISGIGKRKPMDYRK